MTAQVIGLIFSLVGFKLDGLSCLGIAFALQYVVYFLQVYIIAWKKYEFSFSNSFIKSYCLQLVLVVMALAIVMVFDGWMKYTFGSVIIALSCYLGLKGLNQRMNLLGFVKNKIAGK